MKKAFTLMEIVVAITILSIGVLGVSAFFAKSSRLGRLSGHTSVASNLAQGLIESEQSKSYEELIAQTGSKTRFSEESSDPYYIYSRQVNVTLIDSNLNTSVNDLGLKKIDVFVYWNEGTEEKNVQISTIKTEQ